MFMSKIALANWRSYDSAEFNFKPPTPAGKKPIVLIGAMNGHGKTSFLLSLYLGLFGRHGLRYCEGFRGAGDADTAGYRRAIESYRRIGADPAEPTQVDLTFIPTLRDSEQQKEVRVVRRWFFTGSNKLRQGEGFEEVQVFVDGKPLRASDSDAAMSAIELALFPAHVTPAFFFDGEQAQSLIEKMGEEGLRKAVEVMFGMKVVTELKDSLRTYLSAAHNRAGGRGRSSTIQDNLDAKKKEREAVNDLMGKRQLDLSALRSEHENMSRERSQKMEDLAKYGGAATRDVGDLQRQYGSAEKQKESSEKALTVALGTIGLNLALTRLGPAIRNRLLAEGEREAWEGLRTGTLAKREEVLAVAMPQPSSADPLLGVLSTDVLDKLRTRLLSALDRIYNPPPTNCADDFLLGHIRGEQRARVLTTLDQLTGVGGASIRQLASQAKDAREQMDDAKSKLERIGNLPTEVKSLKERIEELNGLIGTSGNRIGQLDNEITSLKSQLHDLNADVGRLQEELARLEPEQARLAVAERVNRVIEALSDALAPMTATRIEELVTKHFISIADERFAEGQIELRQNQPPAIRFPGQNQTSLLEVMSGFESRAFGIAFSLALAEFTRQRIPLIIDTPLGNADSEYRPRTLAALRRFDLDQIIVLTHDEEVTERLFDDLRPFVNQTFLVKFDSVEKRSKVFPDKFFWDPRR